MKKFKCYNCGYCCSNFGPAGTLPIFHWEKKKLEAIATKKNISLNFIPENVYYDSISKKIFFVNYGMKNMPCPFLKNNKCSIYNERPLICKSFPIGKNPLFEKKEISSIKPNWFIHCKNYGSEGFIKEINNPSINVSKKIEKYIQTFGEMSWNSSFKIEKIKYFVESEIKKLVNLGKISIKEFDWIDYKKHTIVNVFDFLVMRDVLNEKRKEQILEKFKN